MGCGTNLPSVSTLFTHATRRFIGAWIIAAIVSIICLGITINHVLKLAKRPPSKRRDLYVEIVWVGFMFCVTAALTMVFPRAYVLFDVLQTCFEVHIIYSFGMLLMNYISVDNVYDPREVERKCLENLRQLPPRRYLAVPPCCCFFFCGPHARPRQFDESLVKLVTFCIKQYLFIGPLMALVALWLDLESGNLNGKKTQNAYVLIRIVGVLSILTAIWSLFILYKATRHILAHYHTTAKFVAIKLMLLITAIQELVISAYIKKHKTDEEGVMFTIEFKAHFFMSLAVCIEGFIMALMLINAFPERELDPNYESALVPKKNLSNNEL
eukprot:c1779_g1_i1.p1 GENE.c1779_g1_i1~~c1779_g1_i1.p1  ORF type:complete len:326 (+),score=51.44 c1779_g1_i1:73-1050(+)